MTRSLPPGRRLGALAALIAGVLAAVYVLFRPVSPAQAGTAPNFTLATTTGARVMLSNYRGHPMLLNFFATWCAPCREELPLIARARRAHPDLVTLLIDERETASQVHSFLHDLHVPLPALLDTNGNVAARYSITGQPVSVWIAASGRIRAVSRGPLDRYAIDSRYRQLQSHL